MNSTPHCLRCGTDLKSTRPKLLDKVMEATQQYDTYFCPACGHVEFFVNGIGEERRGAPHSKGDPDRKCVGCGERVPLTFDTCWNCGRGMK